MTYSPAKHYAGSRRIVGRRLLLLGLTVFLVFLGTVLVENFTDFFVFISKPLWSSADYLGEKIYAVSGLVFSKERLLSENKKLEQTVAALEAKLANYEFLTEDLTMLREDYGLLRDSKKKFLLARVISDTWHNPYDILVVDLGWGNRTIDFQVGDLVRVYDSILLGRVAAVDRFSSRIQLFSAPGTEIPVAVGKEAVPALAVGRGGGNFTISLPRGLDIAPGDVVSVPSRGDEVVLGAVGAIDKDSSSSLQTLYLRLPFNLSNLKYVAIYPG